MNQSQSTSKRYQIQMTTYSLFQFLWNSGKAKTIGTGNMFSWGPRVLLTGYGHGANKNII